MLVSDSLLCVGRKEARDITSSETSLKGAELQESLKRNVALAVEGKLESFCVWFHQVMRRQVMSDKAMKSESGYTSLPPSLTNREIR